MINGKVFQIFRNRGIDESVCRRWMNLKEIYIYISRQVLIVLT